MSTKKIGVRCAICGRALSDPISVLRGIGPICKKKYTTDDDFRSEFHKELKQLHLPCYLYPECRFCPHNIQRICPRERLVLVKDLKNKEKICAFCGNVITNGLFTYKSKNKRVLACTSCNNKIMEREKNGK